MLDSPPPVDADVRRFSVCVVETAVLNIPIQMQNTSSQLTSVCDECISMTTAVMLVDRARDCCLEMMCANAVSATEGC